MIKPHVASTFHRLGVDAPGKALDAGECICHDWAGICILQLIGTGICRKRAAQRFAVFAFTHALFPCEQVSDDDDAYGCGADDADNGNYLLS